MVSLPACQRSTWRGNLRRSAELRLSPMLDSSCPSDSPGQIYFKSNTYTCILNSISIQITKVNLMLFMFYTHMDGNSAHLDHRSESMHFANAFFASKPGHRKRLILSQKSDNFMASSKYCHLTWTQGQHRLQQ